MNSQPTTTTQPAPSDAFAAWRAQIQEQARKRIITESRLRSFAHHLRQREINSLVDGRLAKLPTKGQMSNARKSYRVLAHAQQPHAMTNMPAPAGHQSLPRFPDGRSQMLYAAHRKRQDSGWLHG